MFCYFYLKLKCYITRKIGVKFSKETKNKFLYTLELVDTKPGK